MLIDYSPYRTFQIYLSVIPPFNALSLSTYALAYSRTDLRLFKQTHDHALTTIPNQHLPHPLGALNLESPKRLTARRDRVCVSRRPVVQCTENSPSKRIPQDRFRLCIPERLPPPRGPLESSSTASVRNREGSGGASWHGGEEGVGTSCVRESDFVKGLVGSLFVSGARPVRTCSVRHSCALDLIVCISLAQTLPGGSLKSLAAVCVSV